MKIPTIKSCILFAGSLGLLLFSSLKSSAQVDYYYGRNLKGLRLIGGIGFNVLENKFQVNPVKISYTGGVEYNTNQYLCFGLEYQGGTLVAQNKPGSNHQPYSQITNTYQMGDVYVKASLGLFDDFDTNSLLVEKLKDLYIGTGVGFINTSVKYIDAYEPTPDYIVKKPKITALSIPFDIGINVDLPKIAGKDILQANANFQVNMVNSQYLEGFSSYFTKVPVSFYNVFSVGLRVKL